MIHREPSHFFLLLRPRLEGLADRVLERRMCVVAAGAGFGKSLLLEWWSERLNSASISLSPADRALGSLVKRITDALRLRVPAIGFGPQVDGSPSSDAAATDRAGAVAGFLASSLESHLSRPIVLMLDDVHELAGSESAAFLEALIRHAPPRLKLILSGRGDPPVRLARLRARGEVLDITASDLAFSPAETEQLAEMLLGEGQVLNAQIVHSATAGWPAATRLALEALRDRAAARASELLERAPTPGNLLFEYLAEEVLAASSEPQRRLLISLSELGEFTPTVVEALGLSDLETLTAMVRHGVFLEERDGKYMVRSLISEFLASQRPIDPEEAADLHRRAADWYRNHHDPLPALHHARLGADQERLIEVLEELGERAMTAGGAEMVLRACQAVSPPARSVLIERLYGEAQLASGDWEGALATFSRIGGEQEAIDPGLAWRMGLSLHLRGELVDALEAYGRGDLEAGNPIDRALLLGWWAGALWLTGDLDQSRRLAARAEELAAASGSDRALAAALTVQAMLAASDGDRRANELLYLRALESARRAGDILQLIRIHVNRGSRHLEEGSYEEAIAETELALPLADIAGYTSLRALGVNNRGQARMHLGRFEEAITDLRESAALWQQLSARQVAYSMSSTGEIHRLRGDQHLARLSYEEAIRVAEPVGDAQALAPALAGLARVLAGEEPDLARALVERALALGPVLGHASALLAAAEVRLTAGEVDEAGAAAAVALEFARGRRDRAVMAEALEILAGAGDDPIGRLTEAIAIWEELGNPLGQARAALRLTSLKPSGEGNVIELISVLRRLGARRLAEEAAQLLDEMRDRLRPAVFIGALGGLRVVVEGSPVAAAAWQSKKARDILKLLVARRGKPLHREVLLDLLWPDEDPKKTANRLSVALSVVRAVLDPDRVLPPDHYLEADRESVGLRLDHVSLDLELFHAAAAAGFAAARGGNRERAQGFLEEAEAAYQGDFLEEDLYEDWAIPAREEARATYISVTRWLADQARATGKHDSAVRYLLRLLWRDPYDENAHLDLVRVAIAARRHGEARRLYSQYCARMEELGMEASPYPAAATLP
jgi:ATP/maltotriose-dependent transcriptional regulator MalT/DNA-binding SARP family transcriptional activator